MYKVILENNNGIQFRKIFDSPYKMRKFLNKATRSKDLSVLGTVKVD